MPNNLSLAKINIELGINPARLCLGLGSVGYTPATALTAIVDNAITAKAQNIQLLIHKKDQRFLDTRKNNLQEYLVIDDGEGMDEFGLQQALQLGDSAQNHRNNSLAKFGLGLKAAAFSQGEELHLISSPENGPFQKYVVSLPAIAEQQRYFASKVDLSTEDQKLIQQHLPQDRGTIVRITGVRKNNSTNIQKIVEELKNKLGVIYYYFLAENKLKISLGEEQIKPFDVLFTKEAEQNGNLEEYQWDGQTVKWIQKPKQITLEAATNVQATIEVTQLPQPKCCELAGIGTCQNMQNNYKIGAGNYGYYVYRNKRLISWADSLEGIIPQDQDLDGFRGRILIDETADESLTIDIKKSRISLSDEAWNEISDRSELYKYKSQKAWQHARSLLKGEANPRATQIYRTTSIENNALWEPYTDSEHGGGVKINREHQFARLVFEENSSNTDLQVIFELLLLQMAEAEVDLQKSITSHTAEEIRQLIAKYRHISSENLAAIYQKFEIQLSKKQ